MKVVAVLEEDVSRGGGFNQALSAVGQMARLCEGRHSFEVLTTHAANIESLRTIGVAAQVFTFSLIDKALAHGTVYGVWNSLQARLRLTGPFERRLEAMRCDLVYFVTPTARAGALQRLNYIATVWDLCHRDAPEFPEVRAFRQLDARDRQFLLCLPAAYAILTDSDTLADHAAHRYGIDRDRLLGMPFAPAPFMSTGAADTSAVLARHGLREGYLFYPAQFWAHKNHVRILEALAILRARGEAPQVVFAGGEQGNRAHVEASAARLKVRDQVSFVGFVPGNEMPALYRGCAAVVMPTYFGPTNIPPLEAWMAERPLVYSSTFRGQVGDAAVCVDPDRAAELADAMSAVLRPEVRDRLVRAGTARLKEVEALRAAAEASLLERLDRFAARRECWA